MAKLIITITEHKTEDPEVVGFETNTEYDESDGKPSQILQFLKCHPILSCAVQAAISCCCGQRLHAGLGPVTEKDKAIAVAKLAADRFPAEIEASELID
jgi:hypothetical protein